MLEAEGVIANLTIGEYPLYFIPFDEDVLSLELERSFKVQFTSSVFSLPVSMVVMVLHRINLTGPKLFCRKLKWMGMRVLYGMLQGHLPSFRYIIPSLLHQ